MNRRESKVGALRPRVRSAFDRQPIVVWAGRHSKMHGYSVAARNYATALRRAGIRAVAFDTDLLEVVGPTPAGAIRAARKGKVVEVTAVDPDTPLVVVYHERPDNYARVTVEGRARLIGYSVFETTSLPFAWQDPMLSMDGIWTASEFNKSTFADSGVPPFMIEVVPHCIDLAEYDQGLPRLEIPGLRDTVFLSVVSNFNRKDTGMLLRAYLRAFRASDSVSLVLKTMGPVSRQQFESFVAHAIAPEFDLRDRSLPHVRFLPVRLSQERMVRLYNTCDVYVSTERGKGWDIPAMETMALGKCNIGIGWSANTEFMNNENSILIEPDERLVHADPMLVTARSFYAGQLWPSVDERRVEEQLRHAYEDRDLRQRTGTNAREYVARHLSVEAVGRLIAEKVASLQTWDYRGRTAPKVRFSRTPIAKGWREKGPRRWEQLDKTTELIERLEGCAAVPVTRPLEKLSALADLADAWRVDQNKYLPCDAVDRVKQLVEERAGPLQRYLAISGAERAAARFREEFLVSPTPETVSSGAWGKARRRLWGRYGSFRSPKEELERLRSLKDRYAGNRVFVIGNGPSLNKMDLSKLRNEYTFAANKIYLLYDRIDWRPTFYTAMDWEVTPDSAQEINRLDGSIFFFPERFRGLLRTGDDVYWYRGSAVGPQMADQFATDIRAGVRSRGSVLVSAIQIAFHLGFREIYLIGVDCSYRIPQTVKQSGPDRFGTGTKLFLQSTADDDPNHFDPRYFGAGAKWHDPNTDEMKRMFRMMRKGVEVHGGRLMNATAGGELEELDRVDFDSLFSAEGPRVTPRPAASDGAIHAGFTPYDYDLQELLGDEAQLYEDKEAVAEEFARNNGARSGRLPARLGHVRRKLRKLRQDPKGFFRDSRYRSMNALRYFFS